MEKEVEKLEKENGKVEHKITEGKKRKGEKEVKKERKKGLEKKKKKR